MKVGYVIISSEVILYRKAIGYFYREEPEEDADSGWRFFSGDESQDFADDAENFMMYNASTIVEFDPAVACHLGEPFPVAFERNSETGEFIRIEEKLGS